MPSIQPDFELDLDKNSTHPGGIEIFAKWVPKFDQIFHEFVTDANGYDIVSHQVTPDGKQAFAATFVPVDTSITASDYSKKRMLTVWNDRP